MHIIISPAKQMRIAQDLFAPRGIPPFPDRTARLVEELRQIERTAGAAGLKQLWRVNDKLLAENIERLHEFVVVRDADELAVPAIACRVTPAVFSYVGLQYRSLAAEVLDETALAWLEEHLVILSALYGCVRPFDAVEPYRLEMAAKLAVGGARDLYAFWGNTLARHLVERDRVRGAEPVVVNLASVEYAKAVLPHLPAGAHIYTCLFGEGLRGERPLQRATASKIARGSMVRWMAEGGVDDAEELRRFDVGYTFRPELSRTRERRGVTEHTLVFLNDSCC